MRNHYLVDIILESPQNEVGTTNIFQHEIVVNPGVKRVRQAPRRLSPAMEKFAQEEVKRMLDNEIVEKSNSDWCSRSVIVKKAKGDVTLRLLQRLEKGYLDRCIPNANHGLIARYTSESPIYL